METDTPKSELETEIEELTREKRSVETFLSGFGHEAKNYIAPIPGFSTISLLELLQLGANFNRDLYSTFLENLLEEEKLQLPGFVEVPEKIGEFELTTVDGRKVETIDDLKISWLGKLTEYTLRIYDAAARSDGLLKRVLDLNRIRSGMESYKWQRVDISQVVGETVKITEQMAREKGLYLKKEVEQGLPVRADLGAVREVLNNLVGNAIKYTPAGGVTVRAEKDEKENIIRIAVSDTGVGISPNEAEIVFQPFKRLSKTEEEVKGHGLGMFVTETHIRAHGGKIWIESEGIEGRGSTFYVTLPMALDGNVILVKDKETENFFFLYKSGYKDLSEIDSIPLDFIVGATEAYTLTDLVTPLTYPTEFYLGATEETKKDAKGLMEMVLEPTIAKLGARLKDIRDRFAQGKLYFVGIDLERFREHMLGFINSGASREEMDKSFSAELKRALPKIKRGKIEFFRMVLERDSSNNQDYFYEMGVGYTLLGMQDLCPNEFMKHILDDLIAAIQNPRNYQDIPTFERNIAQKGLAFIYANRISLEEEFRGISEGPMSHRLYYLVEKEFKKIVV